MTTQPDQNGSHDICVECGHGGDHHAGMFERTTDTYCKAPGCECAEFEGDAESQAGTPEAVIYDALVWAGGKGANAVEPRFPEVYERRARIIAQALREAGMLNA